MLLILKCPESSKLCLLLSNRDSLSFFRVYGWFILFVSLLDSSLFIVWSSFKQALTKLQVYYKVQRFLGLVVVIFLRRSVRAGVYRCPSIRIYLFRALVSNSQLLLSYNLSSNPTVLPQINISGEPSNPISRAINPSTNTADFSSGILCCLSLKPTHSSGARQTPSTSSFVRLLSQLFCSRISTLSIITQSPLSLTTRLSGLRLCENSRWLDSQTEEVHIRANSSWPSKPKIQGQLYRLLRYLRWDGQSDGVVSGGEHRLDTSCGLYLNSFSRELQRLFRIFLKVFGMYLNSIANEQTLHIILPLTRLHRQMCISDGRFLALMPSAYFLQSSISSALLKVSCLVAISPYSLSNRVTHPQAESSWPLAVSYLILRTSQEMSDPIKRIIKLKGIFYIRIRDLPLTIVLIGY